MSGGRRFDTHRWLVGCLVLVVVLVVVYAGRGVVLQWLGGFLVVDDRLERATAVVVMGGGVPLRAQEAARLYHAGWAPRVVVTRAKRTAEYYTLTRLIGDVDEEREFSRRVLVSLAVPPSAIVMLDDEVENTREELALVRTRIAGAATAPTILVTSKLHTRRVRLIWNHVAGTELKAIVRPVTDDSFDQRAWWRQRRFALAVVREYLGLVNYWFAFPMG